MQSSKVSKNIYKRILKIALWFCVSIISIALVLFISAYLLQDKIAAYAVDKLNENLNTSLTYQKIHFSFISRFPDASLEFEDVNMKEVVPYKKKGTLFRARHFYARFNIWDIITGNYTIRKIEIIDGSVALKHFSDGTDNYQIFKSDTTTNDSGFNYDLNKVILKRVHFSLLGYKDHEHYAFTIKQGQAKGNFSDDVYNLKIDGDILIHQIMTDSINYLRKKEASVDFIFDVDNKNSTYKIKQGDLNLNKIPFFVEGLITYSDSIKKMDFNIKGNNLKLHDFIKELPAEYQNQMSDISTDGNFSFDFDIFGDFDSDAPFEMNLKASMKNGSLTKENSDINFKNLNFNLVYTNGGSSSLKNSKLYFKNFSTTHKMGQISGEFSIINLESPIINAKLKGTFNLADLTPFIGNEVIKTISGKAVADIILDLKLKQWSNIKSSDFIGSKSAGMINLNNVNIEIKDNPNQISGLNGVVLFSNTNLILERMNLNYGKTNFDIDGSLIDIFPYFFNSNYPLKAKVKVSTKNIDFDDLLKSNSSDKSSDKKLNIPQNILAEVDFQANKIKFGKFTGTDLKTSIYFINGRLDIPSFKIFALDGNITANGKISKTNENTFFITLKAKIKDVNARKTFYAFDDFGQEPDGLTYNKINGTIDADIELVSEWNSDFSPRMDRLMVISDAVISNGEIRNYSTLEALSKYIKVSNLSEIKFETLKNVITIRNEVITIPEMEIKSNAVNLWISGTHTFKNEINYRIRILLSEVLGNKAKEANKNNQEFDIEDDGLGKTTLYLLVTGTTDNPKFKYDTKAVKKKIAEDIKTEKNEIKKILFNEFGIYKNDSTINKNANKEKELKEKEKEKTRQQESGKFIIEWDD